MEKYNRYTEIAYLTAVMAILLIILYFSLIFIPIFLIPLFLILITIGIHLGIFISGIVNFDKVLNPEKISKFEFIYVQFIIFVSLFALIYLTDSIKIILNQSEIIKPLIADATTYFEMGSFSLIIAVGFIGIKNLKTEAKKVGVLTLISTAIFFFTGILLALFEMFSYNLKQFLYIQNSLSFLAIYDLFFSVVWLIDFKIKEWKIFK